MRTLLALVTCLLLASLAEAQSVFPGRLPSGCTNGQVAVWNVATNVWICGSGGGGEPAGDDGDVQLNESGSFGVAAGGMNYGGATADMSDGSLTFSLGDPSVARTGLDTNIPFVALGPDNDGGYQSSYFLGFVESVSHAGFSDLNTGLANQDGDIKSIGSFGSEGTFTGSTGTTLASYNGYLYNAVINDYVMRFNSSSVSLIAPNGSNQVSIGSSGAWSFASVVSVDFSALAVSLTAPTVASGFCTTPVISTPNGTAAFVLTVGTSCAAATGTLTMPAAANGWACYFVNTTDPGDVPVQTGGTTTTVTVENYSRTSGMAANFTDSDVLRVLCTGY